MSDGKVDITQTLSISIASQPDRFSAEELVSAAEKLLRDHSPGSIPNTLETAQLSFCVERGWMDPISRDADGAYYRRRHLLQFVAVQVLRGLDLDLDEISTLVQGMNNEHLRLLCDEPAEAQKKAAVMSHWLNMLSKRHRERPTNLTPTRQPSDPSHIAGAPPPAPGSPPPDSPPPDLPAPMGQIKPSRHETQSMDGAALELFRGDAAREQPTLLAHGANLLDTDTQSTQPITPLTPAIIEERRPAKIETQRPTRTEEPSEELALPEAYRRYLLARGIELHVVAGRMVRDDDDLKRILARVSKILGGERR